MEQILIYIIALTLLFGNQYSVGSQNQATHEDRYEQLLEELELSFKKRNYDELDAVLKEVSLLKVKEIPTYERFFFKAASSSYRGDYSAAINILHDFDLMLDIDTGRAKCISNNNISKGNELIHNELVYGEMCWEVFLGYYGQGSQKVRQRWERLEKYSEDLKIKIRRDLEHRD